MRRFELSSNDKVTGSRVPTNLQIKRARRAGGIGASSCTYATHKTAAISDIRGGKRLAHGLGIAGNHGEIGAGGLIGNRSTLLPIAERTEGDVKASGEFLLREAERAADQLDLRRALHALEVGGRKRHRIGIVRSGGVTLRFTHRIEPAPVVLRRLSRCYLRGIVGVHAVRLLGPI